MFYFVGSSNVKSYCIAIHRVLLGTLKWPSGENLANMQYRRSQPSQNFALAAIHLHFASWSRPLTDFQSLLLVVQTIQSSKAAADMTTTHSTSTIISYVYHSILNVLIVVYPLCRQTIFRTFARLAIGFSVYYTFPFKI